MNQNLFQWLLVGCSSLGVFTSISVQAQILPDNSLPNNTVVTSQSENVTRIDGGTTRGTNLFHSFQDFSVPNGSEAFFNNGLDIDNILSRVTGGNRSNLDGLIRANGTANLFLINPAGIMFGKNASLSIGGSFIGSTADSILFPDGIEFSATNTEVQPILTINAPIGLGFRENPGAIVNRSFDEEAFTGLEVKENRTLALIGGEISISEGYLSTEGGRIELGSVGENSSVSLTEVEKGWDVGYEGVENFRDINLSGGAYVESSGENTGDIQVRGRSITLVEGSQIGINTTSGQAGNLEIIASESLKLEETASDPDSTFIFSDVLDNATGADSQLTIETDRLEIKGGQIGTFASDSDRGANLSIEAAAIEVETNEVDALIFSQVFDGATGDAGDIVIDTETLTLNKGAQINASTFGAGNAGNLTINASESIELNGTVPDSNDPSAIFTNVGETVDATGNGGDLAVNTPKLILRDGAQIATAARNLGNGGTITIDVDESILLTGTSPLAKLSGEGRSTIAVSAEPSFMDEEGNAVVTSGNGGRLNLNAPELIIERGAQISADTRSLGNGGKVNLDVDRLILRDGGQIAAGSLIGVNPIDTARGNGGSIEINATESVTVSGTGKIGTETVNSSIFTLAQSSGTAGNLDITTNNLNVRDGGEINTSASGSGAAGNLSITADSLDLDRGTLSAATAAGTGGNIKLMIDDRINLSNSSLISAAATGSANGGNITIDSKFIIARPNQNNDIIASAEQEGTGGRIEIDTQGIFGIQTRSPNSMTNDLDASGGVDGEVILDTSDVDVTRGLVETPPNVVEPDQTVAQTCKSDRLAGKTSGLTIVGKGNIPPAPTEPFNSENILLGGKISTSNLQNKLPNIQPIKTSIGDIVPAKGVVITEDGGVILTANNVNIPTFSVQANCIK